MSESSKSDAQDGRQANPFPSRRDIHGARIPQKPADAAAPTQKMVDAIPAAAPPPVSRAIPRTFPSRRDVLSGKIPITKDSQPAPTGPTGSSPITGTFPPVSRSEPSRFSPPESPFSTKPEETPSGPSADSPVFPSVSSGAISVAALPQSAPQSAETRFDPAVVPDVDDSSADTSTDLQRLNVPQRPEFPGLQPVSQPQQRSRNKGKKKRRQGKMWILILLLVVILGGIAGALWVVAGNLGLFSNGQSDQSSALAPDYPEGPGQGQVTITIETGDYGSQIAQKLYEADVVKSPEAFIHAFDANPASSSIRPGTYTLPMQIPAADAVAALLDDTNRAANTVTVIPGQTAAQVEEQMIAVGDFSQEEIDAAKTNAAELGLPEQAGGNLEGWLFAGSYELSATSNPLTVFQDMVEGTVNFLQEKGVPEDQWMRVLTEASIVEREVVYKEDMPKVARVIENRLDDPTSGGKIGMDSTTLYGVGKTGGIPTAEDLEDDNPYNTRLHPGLPPGPIANPSQEAIEAVLAPADGPWLYFVTVNLDTGETLFTDDFDEHNANVARFQQWCEDNPGRCS